MTLLDHLRSTDDGNNDDTKVRQAVEAIFDDQGQTQKSVLTANQVISLAIARTFAEKYKVKLLNDLCDWLMQLKVSEKGRGRKDMIEAIRSQFRQDALEQVHENKTQGRKLI